MALSESESIASGKVTDLATARKARDNPASGPGSGNTSTGQSTDHSAHRRASGTTDHSAAASASQSASNSTGAAAGVKASGSNRRFDKEKVARIKAEIAEGRYVIDPLRVADKFIEHDRNA